jgi:hypothetical protein
MVKMKFQDWLAVSLLFFVGTLCLSYATNGFIAGEIGTFSKGGSRLVLRDKEELSFYLSVCAFFLAGCFCIGFSFYIVKKTKDNGID